jgi:hypothetical protein
MRVRTVHVELGTGPCHLRLFPGLLPYWSPRPTVVPELFDRAFESKTHDPHFRAISYVHDV